MGPEFAVLFPPCNSVAHKWRHEKTLIVTAKPLINFDFNLCLVLESKICK